MNIAIWFAFTRELISQRDELRERVRQLEAEQKQYIDAFARAANKPEIFTRTPPEPVSSVPGMAFGPTAIRARRALQEEEEQHQILARAEKARNNGGPAIPELPTQ